MRIAKIERENGEYLDESNNKSYNLYEVADGLTIHTNKEIVNDESKEKYVKKKKLKNKKK